jgi:hypothetical protein
MIFFNGIQGGDRISMRLSCVQIQLIYALVDRGGNYRSLMKLSDELCIDYSGARRCLARLEQEGLVTVERRRGYPHQMMTSPIQFERFVASASLRDFQENHRPGIVLDSQTEAGNRKRGSYAR